MPILTNIFTGLIEAESCFMGIFTSPDFDRSSEIEHRLKFGNSKKGFFFRKMSSEPNVI